MHTYLSDCGHPEATPEAMVAAAREAGLEAMGFTDHVIFPEDRARPAALRLELAARVEGLRVFIGCEADMQSPTRMTIDREFAAGLDYVILAASHLYVPGVELPAELNPRTMAALILELTRAAIATGLADIIPHPFAVPSCPYAWQELVAAADREAVSRVAEAAARAGVAIELNPRFLRLAPEEATWLFTRVLEAGCKFAISSDAHHPSHVGCRGERYATEDELRALGVTEDRVWSIEDRLRACR